MKKNPAFLSRQCASRTVCTVDQSKCKSENRTPSLTRCMCIKVKHSQNASVYPLTASPKLNNAARCLMYYLVYYFTRTKQATNKLLLCIKNDLHLLTSNFSLFGCLLECECFVFLATLEWFSICEVTGLWMLHFCCNSFLHMINFVFVSEQNFEQLNSVIKWIGLWILHFSCNSSLTKMKFQNTMPVRQGKAHLKYHREPVNCCKKNEAFTVQWAHMFGAQIIHSQVV